MFDAYQSINEERILKPLESKALENNLALTRVAQIVLDDDARWLLSRSDDYYGIQQRAKQFLEELYHPFTNPEIVIPLLNQSMLGDLWFYAQLEDNLRALTLILGLYPKVAATCAKERQEKRVILEYLEYLSALSDNAGLPAEVFSEGLRILEDWSARSEALFVEASGACRKALTLLARVCGCEERAVMLVKRLLKGNLEFWKASTGIEAWHAKFGGEMELGTSDLSAALGTKFFQAWKRRLGSASGLAELAEIPAYSEIAALHRDMITRMGGLTQKIHYIFYLLGLPGMEDLRDHLLWDLNRQLADLYKELSPQEVTALLDSVFKALSDFRGSHLSIVLDCVLTIGKTVLQSGDEVLSKRLVRKINELGFTPPGQIRINKDWQLDVDKNHLKHIRAYLELIAVNPALGKDLLSALTIGCVRHGVFVSDTDLFQKDVSAFLNSQIKPLYVQIKHLLRLFPVFYNEIGAEGEIRDISTSLDELGKREDRLIHFLRKQVHTESNNTHITLVRRILEYWLNLDPAPLKEMIPEDVFIYASSADAMTKRQSRDVARFLAEKGLDAEELLNLSWQQVQKLFEGLDLEKEFSLNRLMLLCHCHFLLRDKYNLDPYDISKFLSRYSFFDAVEQNRLRQSLQRRDYDSSLKQMLSYITRLNNIILDPNPSTPWENIYYKRHIAAGIPSMYGMYREPKLEAMGMVFRLENVIKRLFERSIAQLNLGYLNGKTLRRIIRILELYDNALRQEMVTNEAFGSALDLLKSSQTVLNLSLDQYLDIFKLMKDSVGEIISEYFYRFYDSELQDYGRAEGGKRSARSQIIAEEFYRSLLGSSFLVQGLDNFVTRILEALSGMKTIFKPQDIARVMSYDPDSLFCHLHSKNSRIENQVMLGSKAYFLKRMIQYEFPIPPGFVITTDLYRHREIINSHPDISDELDDLLKQNVCRLERYTGLNLGDPEAPLLFSVRSGAPMSLPGAMDTFLNIGLNDEITLRLSQRPNYGWTAWDCYRRLIQSWGMAYGIDRDLFDAVMIRYKKKFKVAQKTMFSEEQMRLMVDDYKLVLKKKGVFLEQDPFRQLYSSISHVLDSWNTERAKLYRQKLQIADEWGTAVIIQKMVLGNISLDSGSGVLFTYADWNPAPGICLNGDFTLCSQGEDVVAGLVHTLPISEAQRKHAKSPLNISLEKDYPGVYNRLLRYARQLIEDRAFPHQEIEFTFEGPQEDQLFILQTRNQVIHKAPDYAVFAVPKRELKLLGSGIGIGKGVVNGVIAISRADIDRFAGGGFPLILVRPDTVPDDMDLLFDCQGLLTSRGGVTSHAAVTATRLGISGIVNCRDLIVLEQEGRCRIGSLSLNPGDKIALDATSGSIYLGHYPLQSTHSLI